MTTRQRLVTESMRLFGTNGYHATTVAQLEAAAGLSPGSGSLYRHFPSKEAVLAEGIEQHIAAGGELIELLGRSETYAALSLRESLTLVATAGLRRLDQERDLNRILVRDLAHFPDLLQKARDEEIGRVHSAVTTLLESLFAGSRHEPANLSALSAVLIGAISHYWLLCDVFGSHPAGISESDYIESLVDVLVADRQ